MQLGPAWDVQVHLPDPGVHPQQPQVILFSAVARFIHPVALDRVGLGVAISAAATVINALVGLR